MPDEIARLVDNVVVLVEAEAPPDDPDLLGLYDGVALTERAGQPRRRCRTGSCSSAARCSTWRHASRSSGEEVRITVVHEVAHHFGIDDARLHELGYA